MDLIEYITGPHASGKKFQTIALFTRAFDQIADIKIKTVTEPSIKHLVVHNLSFIYQTTPNGIVENQIVNVFNTITVE